MHQIGAVTRIREQDARPGAVNIMGVLEDVYNIH